MKYKNINKYREGKNFITLFLFCIVKVFYHVIAKLYMVAIKLFSKIDNKVIIFESVPDYSDNSRALSDYLVRNNFNYRIMWAVKDPKKYKRMFPNDGVTFIKSFNNYNEYSIKFLKKIMTAGWLLSTHGYPFQKKKSLKGQKYIRLWHGCSFKDKTTKDNTKENSDSYDVALVAGPLFVKTKAYYWGIDENRIIAKGYPRYDWLLCKSPNAFILKNTYIKTKGKCIVWMPTYRNDKAGIYNEADSIKGFPLLTKLEEWNRIDQLLEKKNVELLIKLHPFQKEYPIKFNLFNNIKEIKNEDFDNAGITLYEFLSVTDGLITDYSSVGVDYLVTDKPIAYTLDDYEKYQKTRGFIIDDPKKYMPGHHLYGIEDLINFIEDIAEGKDLFKKTRKIISNTLIYKSDCYCREICNSLGLE